MQNLNRQPAHYYFRHLDLYDIEVVRRIVYLNSRVAWITSVAVPYSIWDLEADWGSPSHFIFWLL